MTTIRDTTSGYYLRAYDPDAYAGRGWAEWTELPEQALQFPDKVAAWELWRTQSRVQPLRPDGKPNRPLTAYTVTIE